jgi:hypothetical protein
MVQQQQLQPNPPASPLAVPAIGTPYILFLLDICPFKAKLAYSDVEENLKAKGKGKGQTVSSVNKGKLQKTIDVSKCCPNEKDRKVICAIYSLLNVLLLRKRHARGGQLFQGIGGDTAALASCLPIYKAFLHPIQKVKHPQWIQFDKTDVQVGYMELYAHRWNKHFREVFPDPSAITAELLLCYGRQSFICSGESPAYM